MKKTLLSALNHGSGILLTLFSLLCACQVWADYTYTLYMYSPSSPAYIYFWDSSKNPIGNTYPGTAWGSFSKTSLGNNWYKSQITSPTLTYSTQVNCGSGDCKSGDVNGLSNSWIKANGNTDCKDYGIPSDYKTVKSGGLLDNRTFSSFDESKQAFKYELSNISAGTYYYRVYKGSTEYWSTINNSRGNVTLSGGKSGDTNNDVSFTLSGANKNITVYYDPGADVTFVDAVDACTAPTPVTGASSNVTSSSARLAVTVSSGTCTTTRVGVNVYSDSSCETLVDSDETAYVDDETTYSFNISSLSPVTTYYYKAYAKSAAGTTVAASSNNFTTLCRDEIEVDGPADGSMTICAGAGDALSVTASGASDYTYQWYYNSTASTEGATSIDGANSASYSPTISGTKYYYCVVGADTYCDKTSSFSGAITYDSSKTSPVVTASATSVTNYIPVTLTVTGADVNTWNVSGGNTSNRYLYKESGKGAMFKGTVGSGSDVAYTVTGTASNGCSSAVSITVSSNTHHCR